MKLLISLFFLAANVFAADFYILKKNDGCFVKSYVNKNFYDVDYKKYFGIRLYAEEHKRNTKYMVFRIDDQVFVTKKSCMEPVLVDDETDDLIDSVREEDHTATNRITPKSLDGLRYIDNKYYIELSLGKFQLLDKSQLFPDYSIVTSTDNGQPVTFDKNAESVSYKTKLGILAGIGFRLTETRFWFLRFGSFSGARVDKVPAKVGGVPVNSAVDFNWKDSIHQIILGHKFLFAPYSQVKPFVSFGVGIISVQTKADITVGDKQLKASGTGYAGELESGLEISLNKNFALSLSAKYQMTSKPKFRLKDSKDEETKTGFISRSSFSNLSLLSGIKYYF